MKHQNGADKAASGSFAPVSGRLPAAVAVTRKPTRFVAVPNAQCCGIRPTAAACPGRTAARTAGGPSDPDRLVEDADEQATIRRIRDERRVGRGLREIARRLDTGGINCRGGRWSHKLGATPVVAARRRAITAAIGHESALPHAARLMPTSAAPLSLKRYGLPVRDRNHSLPALL